MNLEVKAIDEDYCIYRLESELKATQDGTKNGRNRYMQGNTKHIDKNTKPCSSFVLEPGDVLVLEGAALRSPKRICALFALLYTHTWTLVVHVQAIHIARSSRFRAS